MISDGGGSLVGRQWAGEGEEGFRSDRLFHCHNAEHEDMGMRANLEIV